MPKRKPRDPERSPDLPQNWIERHIERLEAVLLTDPIELTTWQYRRARLVGPAKYEDIDDSWSSISVGDFWGGPDTTSYFKTNLTIPESHAGPDAFLDIEMDGGETQLSINGRMWQGLDYYRSLVPLGEFAESGRELELDMEAFIINYPYDERRHDQRDLHEFRRCNLVKIDRVIEACLADMRFVFDAYMSYWHADDHLEIEGFILHHLEEACRALGPQWRSQDEARTAAAKASAILQEKLFDSDKYRHEGTIDICAHSHLDIVYLWPIKETYRKNGRTTTNMLSLMREFPDYIYSQSQPFLYEKLRDHYPDLYGEVKQWIDDGRWEVVGALYVEPDGNVPGGEAWVRQIMFGRKFVREELGVDTLTCWLPDVFGIMYTLPQILKKSGIKYFLTAKLNIWNDTNVFPYDSFRWRGPDGSEVLAHFPPTHFAQDFRVANLKRHWHDYRQKQTAEENLFIYGWGDGGGGPTREMVQASQRAKRFPGLPETRILPAEQFFANLEEKQDQLPVWDDELYMEGHRGTYTSKGGLKRQNRQAENLYREIEILSVLAERFGGPRIQERLNEGWKLVLLNQFHDTLPGSHVQAAVPDIQADYDTAFAIAHEILAELQTFLKQNLSAEAGDLLLINTLSWKRNELISSEFNSSAQSILVDGNHLPVQQYEDRSYFRASVGSIGWTSGRFLAESASSSTTASFDNGIIETPIYQIELDEKGSLTRLYDKANDREVLSGAGNEFQVFEDDPGKKFGAWDIAYHFEEYRYEIKQTRAWELVENGPLFAVFKAAWQVLDSTIEQEMCLYADEHRIDFRTKVDWQNSKKLLKVAFPLNIRSRTATYDLPFGHIERATHRNTGWEQAKFEVCGHKWADISEGDYGVAILNDCKYGYDAHENVLRLSLVRSPVRPTPKSDIGRHEFAYALLPHVGGWREANVSRRAYEFNMPLSSLKTVGSDGVIPAEFSFVKIDSDSLIVEAIKQAEDGDGAILRVFDSLGSRRKAQFEFGAEINSAAETDLLEENPQPLETNEQGFSDRLSAYEIKSYRLNF